MSGPAAAPASRVRRALATLRAAVALLAAGIPLAALVVRVSLRDTVPGFALLFYAAPWPVLAALLILAGRLWRHHAPRAARAFLIGGLLSLAPFAVNGWRFASPAEGPRAECRVLLWNQCRGAAGWDSLVAEAAAHDADLLVLIESTERDGSAPDWSRRLPGHQVAHIPETTTIAVRGTIDRAQTVSLGRGSFAGVADVRLASGGELTVVAADIHANLLVDRGPAMRALDRELERLDGRPLLLLGDFNLPPDSAHFDAIRRRMRNAFEAAGRGYAPTWPIPLPVLQLDQAWVNVRCEATRCRHGWTFRSDHRPVLLDLKIQASVETKTTAH